PAEPSDHLGDASMVGCDHLSQFFRIEARCQHRRVGEIAEHDRQLAPLGLAGSTASWGRQERFLECRLYVPQSGNGIEQPATVTNRRDTELAQILARESTQNLPINVVVAERGLILFEPEASQPFGHIHRSCPEATSLGDHYNPGVALCP